jgi:hypothetical protein
MEQLFELKKDVTTPGGYFRAGIQKTRPEWEKFFPGSFDRIILTGDEWFIDLSKPLPVPDPLPLTTQIVDEVFAERGLRSISYKQAAQECIERYVARYYGDLQKPKTSI